MKNEYKVKLEDTTAERCQFTEISIVYLGYLVGQIKEIIEATQNDKEQREALKNVLTDKIYDWFYKAEKPPIE